MFPLCSFAVLLFSKTLIEADAAKREPDEATEPDCVYEDGTVMYKKRDGSVVFNFEGRAAEPLLGIDAADLLHNFDRLQMSDADQEQQPKVDSARLPACVSSAEKAHSQKDHSKEASVEVLRKATPLTETAPAKRKDLKAMSAEQPQRDALMKRAGASSPQDSVFESDPAKAESLKASSIEHQLFLSLFEPDPAKAEILKASSIDQQLREAWMHRLGAFSPKNVLLEAQTVEQQRQHGGEPAEHVIAFDPQELANRISVFGPANQEERGPDVQLRVSAPSIRQGQGYALRASRRELQEQTKTSAFKSFRNPTRPMFISRWR